MYTANDANVILRVCNGDEHSGKITSDLINRGLVYLDSCGHAYPSAMALAMMGVGVKKIVSVDAHGSVLVTTEAVRLAGEE